MAQTGFTPISLYYTTTAAAVPTAGNLVAGELAINTQDGKLFYKDAAGVVQVIAGKGGAGVAGGSNTQVQYNSSGSLAGSANMTFSGTALTLANDASISGLTVGKGGGSATGNTALGASALATNLSGTYNTATGLSALTGNTTGVNNSSFGVGAMQTNTTGGNNTALGMQSLASNTTASSNTAVGYQAAYTNTTGITFVAIGERALFTSNANNNVAIGSAAMYYTTSGTENVAVGKNVLISNTTGSYNVALGMQALNSNTTASNNTAVGYQAGYSNATSTFNTFLGYTSGYSYTGTVDSYSTFIGSRAGYLTTSAVRNTFIGEGAGYNVSTGARNTILGRYDGNQGGLDIRTASNYIVLSDGDGNPRVNIDGSGNVMFGGYAFNASINSNFFLFGNGNGTQYIGHVNGSASGTAYQDFRYNGTQIGSITQSGTTAVLYNLTSDQRLKENIVDAPLGNIDDVKVRSFDWKSDGSHVEYGFIAQELVEVAPYAVYQPQDPEEMMAVDYSKLVPMMIKEIQDLKQRIAKLEGK